MKLASRFMALLLTVCLVLAFAGCGNSASSAAASSAAAASSEAAEASAEAPAAEAETAPAASAAEEAPAAEEASAAEETEETATVIDSSDMYPVFDEVTDITAFLNIAPWASAYIGPDADFENAQAILTAEEYTNVHLDVTWSDPDTYNEKVNLLIAALDLPNITRDISGLYSTGADGLIEDGLCVDLNDYLPDYAPDYWNLLQTNDTFREDTATSSGVITTMYSYTELPQYTRGPMYRMDMLEDAGITELPTTVSELHDVALALKEQGIVEAPIVSPKMTQDAYIGVDFISSNQVQMTWYNIDGVITSPATLDSNYEWAKEMCQWNSEGLFVEDWYSPAPFYDNEVLSDEIGIAFGAYSLASDATAATAANPDKFQIVPNANVVLNEGDTIKTETNACGGRGDGDWCITASDEDLVPQICTYVNWFFTEEGSMVSNFGTEGVSYEIDADGNVQFTDLILKDPNGYGSMAVYAIYTNNNDNPFYYKMERTSLTYDNDVEATVFDTWLSNMTSEYVTDIVLTEEETTEYNTYATDLMTTVQETMTKYMTGDIELTEESWAEYQDKLVDLGINEMQAIMQGAFDRENG